MIRRALLLTLICAVAAAAGADPPSDRVARLAESLSTGRTQLTFEPNGFGYLRSLLDQLHINTDTQILVFSKTSFQSDIINPKNPRAVYFNDEVSVGFVPNGEVYEISALDPVKGLQFYSLSTHREDKPVFLRRGRECLNCHGPANNVVPGMMITSVYPTADGTPFTPGSSIFNMTDQRTPFEDRWGGWYVTGTHGHQHHLGNAVSTDPFQPFVLQQQGSQNLTSLAGRFDLSKHLAPTSDIVALMTLEHQIRATNLITSLSARTRNLTSIDHLDNAARSGLEAVIEELSACLLYADEFPLTEPVRGVSSFTETFPKAGPRDAQGRSLRDFDLHTRLFRYPLSYMIYSPAFDALIPNVKARIYRRLLDVLSRKDQSPAFARLKPDARQAALEILRATKQNLPD